MLSNGFGRSFPRFLATPTPAGRAQCAQSYWLEVVNFATGCSFRAGRSRNSRSTFSVIGKTRPARNGCRFFPHVWESRITLWSLISCPEISSIAFSSALTSVKIRKNKGNAKTSLGGMRRSMHERVVVVTLNFHYYKES